VRATEEHSAFWVKRRIAPLPWKWNRQISPYLLRHQSWLKYPSANASSWTNQTWIYSLMKLGVLAISLSFALLAVPAAARLQDKSAAFAAASIRPIPAGTPIRAEVLGVVCHGADGVRQTVIAVKPGIDPLLIAPRGRCVANGVTLQALIGFSYGTSERNVAGGPNWVRLSGPIGLDPGAFTFRETATYAIDAVADDPATVTIEELRLMLQKILTDRFGLKFHREKRQIQGFALVVAKDGPKMKEVKSAFESPRVTYDENLHRSIKGTSTLAELLDLLLPPAFGPVVDKTELAGVYQYEFFAPLPPPPAPPAPPNAPTGRIAQTEIGDLALQPNPISALSAALEGQLGLRLQPNSVPVEVLVIDQVERPSSN
jgi:uncharacterized protein (TIGR03435 family)